MTFAGIRVTPSPGDPNAKARDHQLDLYGITHVGNVRKQNQDHFLLCTVHPQVVIHGTSLPDAETLPLRGERLATIMMVADGVGGGSGGGEASQLALETITRYVASSLRSYHTAGGENEEVFLSALRAAAFEAHRTVRGEATSRAEAQGLKEAHGMATTLTLATVVWPWAYVVQVGDSRCYHYFGGKLTQVTRDQTLAQDLIDKGALPKEAAGASPLSHVLASAIGGRAATPEVTRIDMRPRGRVLLLCSDGLTKHVKDEQIADELGKMLSSEQLCRDLLEMALAGGGSDNTTVLAGRALPD